MITFAIKFAVALVITFAAFPASAQAPYPNRPVRVIVPFPAGGPVDVVGRPIMDKLSAASRPWPQ